MFYRYAVGEWNGSGLATARSWVRIPPVGGCCEPTTTQRAIPLGSVNEYLRGVNGHTTRCTGRVSVVLRLRLVSGWGLWNGDQRRTMGSKARERTLLTLEFESSEKQIWLTARCYNSSLANRTATSRLPTNFSGFMSNVALFKRRKMAKFLQCL